MPKKQSKKEEKPVVAAEPVAVPEPVVEEPVAKPVANEKKNYADLHKKLVKESKDNAPAVEEKQEEKTEKKTFKKSFNKDSNNNNNNKEKGGKVIRPGKTLLVKITNGSNATFANKVFDNLKGLSNRVESSGSNSLFLTFDNVTNSQAAFTKLRGESDYRVKYSYYRVFFTITGLQDSSDYNDVKKSMVDYVESNCKAAVLYYKLYRKESKYIGCGDFTMDTMDGMNALLAKDSQFKTFTLGGLTGTFYRYNGNKHQDNSE